MLNLQEYCTGFLNSIFEYADRGHSGTDPIYRTLGINDLPIGLEFDDVPFIFVGRGSGGHAPYEEFSGSAMEYFEQTHVRIKEEMRSNYRRSIELTLNSLERDLISYNREIL